MAVWNKETNDRLIMALNPFYFYSQTVKGRDNYKCQVCVGLPSNVKKEQNNKLQVHHIFYKNRYPQLAYNKNNGLTLCEPHHMEVHKLNDPIRFVN